MMPAVEAHESAWRHAAAAHAYRPAGRAAVRIWTAIRELSDCVYNIKCISFAGLVFQLGTKFYEWQLTCWLS